MRVRKTQEGMAKAGLQQANLAAAAASAAADRSLEHYEEVTQAPGHDFMAQAERARLAAQAAIEARESLAAARAAAAAALDDYLVANQAVSVLGRLDDRRREEHAQAVQREEAATVDELVTSRHVRRQDRLERRSRQ